MEIIAGKETVDIRVSVRALTVDRTDSRILLVFNTNGLVLLPGGRINPNEHTKDYIKASSLSPIAAKMAGLRNLLEGEIGIDTLYRELNEELKLDLDRFAYLLNSPHKRVGAIVWDKEGTKKKPGIFALDIIHAFSIDSKDNLPIEVDGKEIVDYKWLTAYEMLPYLEQIPGNIVNALHCFGKMMDKEAYRHKFFGQFGYDWHLGFDLE